MKTLFKKIVVEILTQEAKFLLKRKKPTIIAVTGSVGKTSTKDAIYTVLKDHVYARKNQKSYNSEIGVPLTVLGLQNAWQSPLGWIRNILEGFFIALFSRDYPKVLVLEAGVDRPGDMKDLVKWVTPDVVVLTRLPDMPVHVEYFSTPEEVVTEKMELVKALRTEGTLIYNNDDEIIKNSISNLSQQSFGYGHSENSHFKSTLSKVVYDGSSPAGIEFNLNHLSETAHIYLHGGLGVQHTYSFAAAAAVGSIFGVSLSQAAEALGKHLLPPGRMRLLKGINDSVIIDDTYNSSPVACERALETLGELKNAKRRIAVLGDMLELGQFSVREHERMGESVAKNVDLLITVGVRAKKIANGAIEQGLKEDAVFQFEDIKKITKDLKSEIKPGDIILIKASQSIRAEKLVESLLLEPEKANELLVRQDRAWKSI